MRYLQAHGLPQWPDDVLVRDGLSPRLDCMAGILVRFRHGGTYGILCLVREPDGKGLPGGDCERNPDWDLEPVSWAAIS